MSQATVPSLWRWLFSLFAPLPETTPAPGDPRAEAVDPDQVVDDVSVYALPRLCEFPEDCPENLSFPAVLDFSDTWYVSELWVACLLRLARRSTESGQPLRVVLGPGQPLRSLRQKGVLGRMVSEDPDGFALWTLAL